MYAECRKARNILEPSNFGNSDELKKCFEEMEKINRMVANQPVTTPSNSEERKKKLMTKLNKSYSENTGGSNVTVTGFENEDLCVKNLLELQKQELKNLNSNLGIAHLQGKLIRRMKHLTGLSGTDLQLHLCQKKVYFSTSHYNKLVKFSEIVDIYPKILKCAIPTRDVLLNLKVLGEACKDLHYDQ